MFLCLKPWGLSWESKWRGTYTTQLARTRTASATGLPLEYCFSLNLCSLSVEYPESGRHFLENSIQLSRACQLFALGARHWCEAMTHLQFRCFEPCPVHMSSQLSKSICDCCCRWFLRNPFLCSSISWELCKCSVDPKQALPCHLCWGCKLPSVVSAKIEGGSCV